FSISVNKEAFNEIAFLISSSLYIRISIPPLVITSFYLYYIFFCLFRQLRKCMKFFVYFYPNCINKVDIKNISLFCRFKRSEEHTSELQSRFVLVCRLLLERKNKIYIFNYNNKI